MTVSISVRVFDGRCRLPLKPIMLRRDADTAIAPIAYFPTATFNVLFNVLDVRRPDDIGLFGALKTTTSAEAFGGAAPSRVESFAASFNNVRTGRPAASRSRTPSKPTKVSAATILPV